MLSDAELLHRYAAQRDEAAFAEIVRRHVDVVHSAALRRMNGRTHLAEDIAQRVFTVLARKAAAVARHPVLVGWLYQTTRYAAIDVARDEQRRRHLADSLSAMTDTASPPEPAVDWAQLRPVIDAALDQLRERDRQAVLLRYFNGLPYAEIGERLHLSENAARMRTERALERVRAQLERRGIKSASAVLGGLMAHHAVAAAPIPLAGTVTTAAIAAAPAGLSALLGTLCLMKPKSILLASALLATGTTVAVWFSATDMVAADELEALRRENVQLSIATAEGGDAVALAEAAAAYETKSIQVMTGFAQEQARRIVAALPDESRHRNQGIATPKDTLMTFAWAAHEADVEALTSLLWFDPPARAKAEEIWATMPPEVQAAYPTPEALYAFFVAADALIAPPPGAEFVARMNIVDLGPERAAARFPGSDRNNSEYQKTPAGWKYVMPLVGVEHIPAVLQNETLARMAGGI